MNSPGGLGPSGGPLPADKITLIESYVQQLYAADVRQRCLAAQALGNMSSFIPRKQKPDLLGHAVETGVWGSLVDVLASEEDLQVQEACLVAISQLLTSSPDEDHTSPFKAYLKKLSMQLVRLEVLDSMGYVMASSTSSRVVLAGCRVTGVLAQHLHPGNEEVVTASRLIESLVAIVSETNYEYQIRDSAACAVALLALREAGPKLARAVYNGELLQALCLLYQRSIDPAQRSDLVLPGDVMQLLLGVMAWSPAAKWPEVSKTSWERTLRRCIARSSALECMASYVAIEAGALRLGLQRSVAGIMGALAKVEEKNALELEHFAQRLAQLKSQLRMVREEEQEAADAGPDVYDEAMMELGPIKADLKAEIAHVRKAQAPLKYQAERLGRLADFLHDWTEAHGAPPPQRVKAVAAPNLPRLQQTLLALAGLLNPPAGVDKGPDAEAEEWREQLHARLLQGGLLQAVVRVVAAFDMAGQLAGEVASVVSDMALSGEVGRVLGVTAGHLAQQAGSLDKIGGRLKMRLKQLGTEKHKLAKALQFGTAQGSPRKYVALTDTNALCSGVREADVARRLAAVESEEAQLGAALLDGEALGSMLMAQVAAINDTLHELKEVEGKFTRAYPAQAANPSPFKPAMGGSATTPGGGTGGSMALSAGGDGASPASRSVALAPIMEGDGTHPAGALLGTVCVHLLPIALPEGVSNTEALIALISAGARPASGRGLPAVLASLNLRDPGAPAGGTLSRPGSARPGSRASASPVAGTTSRPTSARPGSALGTGAGATSRPTSATAAFRAATDTERRDVRGVLIRYPVDSNYAHVQATHSPMRGYAAPNNGPRYDLRAARDGADTVNPTDPTSGRSSAIGQYHGSQLASVGGPGSRPTSARYGGEGDGGWFGPDEPPMSLPDESHLLLSSVRGSIVFQPLRLPAPGDDGQEGQQAGVSAQNSQQQQQQHRSRPTSAREQAPHPSARSAYSESGANGQYADGVNGDGYAQGQYPEDQAPTVLEALLGQACALRDLMAALCALQGHARGLTRVARSLPGALSFKGISEPQRLLRALPGLHRLWAEAIIGQPATRCQVAEAVADVASIELPGGPNEDDPPQPLVSRDQFNNVYVATGLLDVLLKMMGGQLRSLQDAVPGGSPAGSPAKPKAVGAAARPHSKNFAPPVLRASVPQQAEQAAAARALTAIGRHHPEALDALSQDPSLLAALVGLVFDHSLAWPARQASADLLAGLVLAGGPVSIAALEAGAFQALIEILDRDMFPFYRQDSRGAKVSAVTALGSLAASDEALDSVVNACSSSSGAGEPASPSGGRKASGGGGAGMAPGAAYAIKVGDSDHVLRIIVKALWSVPKQVYTLMSADRTGRGKFVDPELVGALNATAAAAAAQLAALADSSPAARGLMKQDLRLGARLTVGFMQAIKEPALYGALMDLRTKLQ